MNQIEQTLANLGDAILHAAGTLVADANPAYKDLVGMAESLLDEINRHVNPSAPAAFAAISATAVDLVEGVPPVVNAVDAFKAPAATGAQKVSALRAFVGEIELIGGDIISIFHKAAPAVAAPVPVQDAPPVVKEPAPAPEPTPEPTPEPAPEAPAAPESAAPASPEFPEASPES